MHDLRTWLFQHILGQTLDIPNDKLKFSQNSAAPILTHTNTSSTKIHVLADLHSSPAEQVLQPAIIFLVFNSLSGLDPPYKATPPKPTVR